MLRFSLTRLGRWGPRDFLRGRTKLAGAVHTRPTHGSKGRYKRLSTSYTVRDGRRHASNHMKGGLGIKLGGGLFGLRIPRQHALSTMTRAAYELEVYGHPNITNPYRGQIHAHPSLRQVMANATPVVDLVVILPRVARVREGDLPPPWAQTADELLARLRKLPRPSTAHSGSPDSRLSSPEGDQDLPRGFLHLATLGASVRVCLSRVRGGGEALHGALLALYREHQKGQVPLLLSERERGKGGSSSARVPFLGPALRADGPRQFGPRPPPPPPSSLTLAAFAPARGLAGGGRKGPPLGPARAGRTAGKAAEGGAFFSIAEGAEALLGRLRESAPDALGLCLRPSFWGGAAGGEGGRRPAHAKPRRLLLKADVDPDEEVGVWRHRHSDDVEKLLRWYYASRDPRAHSEDPLPHRKRRFSIILLVDASKTSSLSPPAAVGMEAPDAVPDKNPVRRRPSLMSKQLSEKVEQLGFKALRPVELEKVLAAVQAWSVDHQWDHWLRMGLPRHPSPSLQDASAEHSAILSP